MNKAKWKLTCQSIFTFWLTAILLIFVGIANAQQSSDDEEEKFIEPSRPNVANPAEFQKPGVLQVEYGYDANFRGEDFRWQQTAPLTVRFAASKRLLFDFDIDTIISEKSEMQQHETGVGDTRVGVQVLALEDTERHPALAFAYYVKAPTASSEKELGTGAPTTKLSRF
ncbi:MAG TPA: transporter [Pyrinomonadaceae bacterium]|nr:transporter [Pyrinomonadaceae bacterium]